MHNGGEASSTEREERIRPGIDLEGISASMGSHSRTLLGKVQRWVPLQAWRKRGGVVEEEAANSLDRGRSSCSKFESTVPGMIFLFDQSENQLRLQLLIRRSSRTMRVSTATAGTLAMSNRYGINALCIVRSEWISGAFTASARNVLFCSETWVISSKKRVCSFTPAALAQFQVLIRLGLEVTESCQRYLVKQDKTNVKRKKQRRSESYKTQESATKRKKSEKQYSKNKGK